MRNGEIPSAEQLRKEIPQCHISNRNYEMYLRDPSLQAYLQDERSIPIAPEAKLTPKQLDWIKLITDPTDMAPLSKKLAELKLTKTEVNRWSHNPFYRAALIEMSDKAFKDSRNAVLRSLQIEAMSGNMQAVKMYLEMSGDYVPQLNTNVVVEQRTVINNVVAILQELVSPDTLLAVVDRLEQGAVPNHPAAPRPALPAMATPPKRTAPVSTLPQTKQRIVDVESFTNDGW